MFIDFREINQQKLQSDCKFVFVTSHELFQQCGLPEDKCFVLEQPEQFAHAGPQLMNLLKQELGIRDDMLENSSARNRARRRMGIN